MAITRHLAKPGCDCGLTFGQNGAHWGRKSTQMWSERYFCMAWKVPCNCVIVNSANETAVLADETWRMRVQTRGLFRMYLPNNEDIVDLPVHFTFSLVLSFYRDSQNMSMHINKAVLRCLVCWEHSTVNIETTAMKMHRGQSRYQKGFLLAFFLF